MGKLKILDDTVKGSSSLEEREMVEVMNMLRSIGEENYYIIPEDTKFSYDSSVGPLFISDETAVELVKFNNIQGQGGKVQFSELPESLKDQITARIENIFDIVADDNSARANQVRNDLADALVRELDEYMKSYGYKVEHLFDDTPDGLFSIFKKHNDDIDIYIEKLVGSAATEEAKTAGEKILAAIKDSYEMKRIREAIPYTRIKKIDVKRPDRIFGSIHQKYDTPEYMIHNLHSCYLTLVRHLSNKHIVEDATEVRDIVIKILLVFCEVCQNYNVENPAEHGFMYYFTYNIILLDKYEGEQYDEYSTEYLGKIKQVIDTLREFENKNASKGIIPIGQSLLNKIVNCVTVRRNK